MLTFIYGAVGILHVAIFATGRRTIETFDEASFDSLGTDFFSGNLGNMFTRAGQLAGILVAFWGVGKAVGKGFGREGGGIGAFLKALVVPLIIAALVFNLPWVLDFIWWTIKGVGALFEEVAKVF